MAQNRDSIPSPRSLAYLAWLRLMRVMQLLRRRADAEVNKTGFSSAQLALLFELLFAEGVSQQELADEMQLTKGNITQLLEKLEREGLLRRERAGRVRRVYLTEAGRTIAHQYFNAQQSFIEMNMSVLTIEEQAQLLTLLRKLERRLS